MYDTRITVDIFLRETTEAKLSPHTDAVVYVNKDLSLYCETSEQARAIVAAINGIAVEDV